MSYDENDCWKECSPSQLNLTTSRSRINQFQTELTLLEFQQQIEQRYSKSISNHIYTFPKSITSLKDFISSDQSDKNESSDHLFQAQIQENQPVFLRKHCNNQVIKSCSKKSSFKNQEIHPTMRGKSSKGRVKVQTSEKMELFDKINYKIKSQTSNKTFKVIINKLKHKD